MLMAHQDGHYFRAIGNHHVANSLGRVGRYGIAYEEASHILGDLL